MSMYVCLSVSISARLHISKTPCPVSTLHEILCICLFVAVAWSCSDDMQLITRTSGFMDDVVLAHNRPGKGEVNTVHIHSDSPGVSTGAKSDIYDCLVTAASCWCVSQSVIGTVDEPEDSPDGSTGGIFDLAIPWWWVLLLIILGSLLVILLIIIIIIILWRWSVLTHVSIHLYTGWLHRYMSGKPCVCCYSILWNIQYCFWLILANVRFWAPPYITCLFHLSVR